MTVKELKKLLKEFDDDDIILLEWMLSSPWWHLDLDTRELEKTDIMSSEYDGKTRMIIRVH